MPKASILLLGFMTFSVLTACQKKPTAPSSSSKIRFESITTDGSFFESRMASDANSSYASEDILQAQSLRKAQFPKNRIKILFIGDGYASHEQEVFSSDVKSQIQRFLAQEPFKAYKDYFYFESIAAVSEESGVSHSNQILKKTFFEMHYGCAGIDRLLCINTDRVNQVIDPTNPPHMVFALANDDKYGGAGYMSPAIATLAARNAMATELAFHEFGHAFGNLTDEYDDSGVPANCPRYANVSESDEVTMMRKKEKWYQWLDLANIGSYLGSCYSQKYYRPSESSKMRKLGQSFEAVNIEQIILKIYEKLKIVDSHTPLGKLKGHQVIQIKPLRSSEFPHQIIWKLNGKVVPELTSKTEMNTQTLVTKPGNNKIEVQVMDPTVRVRNEKKRSEIMTQILKWNISLP